MVDLIIPYYNNRLGLLNTLNSINQNLFKVTVIDDHSKETPIFPLNAAQLFRLNINSGPGCARQRGIDKTNNPWIMFIDTGDIFISDASQDKVVKAIKENPDANIISFPYIYKDGITKETDNRMHGKIYKRAFLEKYSITFAAESSYLNEDIGFNRTCRLCTEVDGQPIVYKDVPIIEWIKDENSLTQKNDNVSLYKDQTRALSLTSIHTINICRNNNINIAAEINQIAIALYYWFIRTAAERPIYIEDAWAGARIFYKHFEKEIDPNKLLLGNPRLKQCLQYRGKVAFPINILRFTHDIWINEKLPDQYLTFSEI